MTLIGLFIFGELAAGIDAVAMRTMSLDTVGKKYAGSASGTFSAFRYVGSTLSSVAIAVFYHEFIFMLVSSVIGLPLILVTVWGRTSTNHSGDRSDIIRQLKLII